MPKAAKSIPINLSCIISSLRVSCHCFALSTDVNECEDGDPCHPLAACKNTEGGFICTCKEGLEGDGIEYCGMYPSMQCANVDIVFVVTSAGPVKQL